MCPDSPDYLLIGHLCRDWVDGAWRLGGTAAYAGVAASRLGRRVAVASLAVEGRGVAAVPSRSAVERRLQTLHPSPFTLHPGEKGRGG